MKAVLALFCCLALLAGPALVQAGLMVGAPAGCCHAGQMASGHLADNEAGHHDHTGAAPSADCVAFCAVACCVAVLPVNFVLDAPARADFAWRDFSATGLRRADRPPLPPPRARATA